MLEEIDFILSKISDTDYESFIREATLKRAFVRSLEVIGEALKKAARGCQGDTTGYRMAKGYWNAGQADPRLFRC